MGTQEQAFLDSEGRAWLERNKTRLPVKDDPVIEAIEKLSIRPTFTLEIGCADGWRLKELARKFPDCQFNGIDPGIHGYHRSDGINLYRGTAANLHAFRDNSFDLIIFGFCLYLCDPEDYFKIAMEADRVLVDQGILMIYDFFAHQKRVPYHHKPGLFSHKMQWDKLWGWHPYYGAVAWINRHDEIQVVALRKSTRQAFT